jgi:dolichol-phosphate mannosyltransferase
MEHLVEVCRTGTRRTPQERPMKREHGGEGALICIPTYNEAENLPLIVPAVLDAVPGAHVLVVDDASPDGTGRIADALAAASPHVHVLHRAGKEGLGRAYLAAFHWALARDYRYVFEFDADFSHNPLYLPEFIGLLEHDADVVVGSRRVPGGGVENWGPVRRFVSWGGSTYARTILGVHVRDLTGGFNGFRREVLERIGLDDVTSTGYCFQIELKYRALRQGFRVIERPIVFPDRVRGTSKMNSSIIAEAMLQVWKLRGLKP